MDHIIYLYKILFQSGIIGKDHHIVG